MLPLDAVSFASAIVAFVDFSCKLIKDGVEIYKNFELQENADLDLIQCDLGTLLNNVDGSTSYAETEDQSLVQLIRTCTEIGRELSKALERLKRQECHTPATKAIQSAAVSWRNILGKTKLRKLEDRLLAVRAQIEFKLIILISKNSKELLHQSVATQQELTVASEQAASIVRTWKTQHREEFEELSAFQQKILENMEAQRKAFDNMNEHLMGEIQRLHYATLSEIRIIGTSVDIIHDRVDIIHDHVEQLGQTFADQITADKRRSQRLDSVDRTLAAVLEHIETQEARQMNKQKRGERLELRKKFDALLHPKDSDGNPRQLSDAEKCRYFVVATVVTLAVGAVTVFAMRGEDGRLEILSAIKSIQWPKQRPLSSSRPALLKMKNGAERKVIQPIRNLSMKNVPKPLTGLGENVKKVRIILKSKASQPIGTVTIESNDEIIAWELSADSSSMTESESKSKSNIVTVHSEEVTDIAFDLPPPNREPPPPPPSLSGMSSMPLPLIYRGSWSHESSCSDASSGVTSDQPPSPPPRQSHRRARRRHKDQHPSDEIE